MKLIWHSRGLMEIEWVRHLLGAVITQEIVDVDLLRPQGGLHVISSNTKPLPAYEDYCRLCRLAGERNILLHLSDEWFSGGYELYRHFDAVLRNFHTYLADAPGIMTIPEGYSNGLGRSDVIKPADQRRFAWSFIGEVKTSRVDMVRAFDGFEPQCLVATSSISESGGRKLSKSEYAEILRDTAFSPCPMGNAILETWRLYESLETGCIPLAETRLGLDYFTKLLGEHPIPVFRRWTDARAFAEQLYSDQDALSRKQSEIAKWWAECKRRVAADVLAFIQGPSHAADLQRYASYRRNRFPILHEPLRLAELIRHQSASSLRRRLVRPGNPVRRIVREATRAPSR